MVANRLREYQPEITVELVIVKTMGDIRQDVPLSAVAGKGIFIREIENALLRGEADIAVHSCKDLPSTETPHTTLAAFCERHDPRDALITRFSGWDSLPQGATVATSAPRRIAQLKHVRPDINCIPIRGNVDTRLAKLDAGIADALVLAVAGVERLGFADRITEHLPISLSLPQVGQGCVAVQCRHEDIPTISLVKHACDHPMTHGAVQTEREFLSLLGGGCTVPVAAHAWFSGHFLFLKARVATEDGSQLLEVQEAIQVGGMAWHYLLLETENDFTRSQRSRLLEEMSKLAQSVYNQLLEKGAMPLLERGNDTVL
jgi:hydroxymethylbilane synthase